MERPKFNLFWYPFDEVMIKITAYKSGFKRHAFMSKAGWDKVGFNFLLFSVLVASWLRSVWKMSHFLLSFW